MNSDVLMGRPGASRCLHMYGCVGDAALLLPDISAVPSTPGWGQGWTGLGQFNTATQLVLNAVNVSCVPWDHGAAADAGVHIHAPGGHCTRSTGCLCWQSSSSQVRPDRRIAAGSEVYRIGWAVRTCPRRRYTHF
jgi:predicted ABC-type sugar transport system permease subunit